MEDNSFAKLEERIGQAIQTISTLRRERDDLRRQREQLQSQMEGLERGKSELEEKLESVKADTVAKSEFDDRKREIERRVESLLQRFDELDEGTES